MTTLFGVLLLVGGFTVLAVVRPWQSEDRDRGEVDPPGKGGFPPSRPRPGPRRGAAVTRSAASGAATASSAATASGTAAVSNGATVSSAATVGGATASGAAVSGAVSKAATVGAGATRRPSPVRGLAAARPLDAAAHGGADALTGVIPAVAPGPAPSPSARTRVPEAPAGDGPSGTEAVASGVPSPVVPLKPRPAARRAEPRPDRVPVRHHRVETIQRGRRVSAEPGDFEIVLPEWLGPMSVPENDAAPVRARHAG